MKDERKKVDAPARRCVLVGYGTVAKGYRLYDPNRGGKVIYSREVKFNKTEFGLEKEPSSLKPVYYVKLDVSSYTEEQQERAGSCEDVTDPYVYVEVPVARRSGM